jgi:hypothetical protein
MLTAHNRKKQTSVLGNVFKNPMKTLLLVLYAQTQLAKAAMPSELAALNPIAYYPFNGNTLDETGHGNDAVLVGPRLDADRNGISNQAYFFNGSDYMYGPSKKFPDEERTISFWLKPSYFPIAPDRDVGGILMGYGGNGICGTSFLVILNELCAAPANSYNIQSHCRIKNIELVDNSLQGKDLPWMHFALTTESGIGTKIYINNKQLLHDPNVYYDNTEIENGKFAFGAGVYPDGSAIFVSATSPFYRGLMDDIIILGYAASPAQINILYNLQNDNSTNTDVNNNDDDSSDLMQIIIGIGVGSVSGALLAALIFGCFKAVKKIRTIKMDNDNPHDPFDRPRPDDKPKTVGQDGFLEHKDEEVKVVRKTKKSSRKNRKSGLEVSLLESEQKETSIVSNTAGKLLRFFKTVEPKKQNSSQPVNSSFRHYPVYH